jgi:hypothetical protein
MRKQRVQKMTELRARAHRLVERLDTRLPSGEAGVEHLLVTARMLRLLSDDLDRKAQAECERYEEYGPRSHGVAYQVSSCVPKLPPQRYRHYER